MKAICFKGGKTSYKDISAVCLSMWRHCIALVDARDGHTPIEAMLEFEYVYFPHAKDFCLFLFDNVNFHFDLWIKYENDKLY